MRVARIELMRTWGDPGPANRRMLILVEREGLPSEDGEEGEQTLQDGQEPSESQSGSAPSIQSIGRFVVLRPLGRGGMGMVYLAYDPELDRRIAIKLLRPSGRASIGSTAAEDERQRLRREAQALARLSHPNVVAVHDVGEHEGQIFVAMEFVDGVTLSEAMESNGPGTHQIPVFLQAARGLAAAHAEGLVHRDFKPANVMVGRDGRARVMDFGLARESGIREAVPEMHATGESMLSTELTQEGSIVGTPRYMAPEQWAGTPASQATDQFSFCVALWRAVYGTAPYLGETSASLAFNVSQGHLNAAPRGRGVPRYVQRALVRGLQVSPALRFPSMGALIEALEGGPKRRRLYLASGIGLAVAALAGTLMMQRNVDPCPDPSAELEEVWGKESRQRVRDALEATPVGRAAGLADSVTGQIDAYSASWSEQRRDVCRATRVRGEQSEELMDLRMACLDDAREQLGALVGVLQDADNDVALRALDAVAGLGGLSRCEDGTQLRNATPMPTDPNAVRLIEVEQARLARADAEGLTGQYTRSAENAERSIEVLEGLDYPPALVRAHTIHGDAVDKLGRVDDAVASYRSALGLAIEHDLPLEAISVLLPLSTLVGVEQGQEQAGQELLDLAAAFGRRIGDQASDREYWIAAAQLWGNGARSQDSLEAIDRALELSTEPRHRSVAYNRRATTLRRIGRFDEALADQRQARALSVEANGERHPDSARMALNEAGILFSLGQVEQAKVSLDFVVAVCEETGDDKSSLFADAYVNLGTIASAEGDNERAAELFTQALALYDAELGSKHPNARRTLTNLGAVEVSLGRNEKAREHLDRAVSMVGDVESSADAEVGALLNNYGDLLNELGDYEGALERHSVALEVMERGLGSDAVWLSYPLRGMASDLVGLGRAQEAIPMAQRASKLQVDQPSNERLHTELVLGQALWHSGEKKQARAVITTLEAALAKGDPAHEVVRAKLSQWRERVEQAP